MKKKILVTCPPMLQSLDLCLEKFENYDLDVVAPEVVQTLSEQELIDLVPNVDGWIIGDDPATKAVFQAGRMGKLRAAVKWGIGTDNVDFTACEDLGIPITNTPNMFGREVADVAMGYIIGLARETFLIDRQVRLGNWVKPAGISLQGKNVGLVGFGDIGKNVHKRLIASDMNVTIYDPYAKFDNDNVNTVHRMWPDNVGDLDFLVFTCSLTESSYHMFNDSILEQLKPGVRIVNVGRGGLINEKSLEDGLKTGVLYSAALDVFEEEPISQDSYLLEHPRCVLGTHNSSNTVEAVVRTSYKAIDQINKYLSSEAV
ncbi:phosphoglycerate dehydrogenase [Sessilibacter corallicola]|uniref:phosphoglycerate dehydrogenase n=1 Tax=Sessilibacter corallicola TaxID=2904075 RepID=UPI001E5C8355|nr:phosphoglycerate dehydrogenase [Sessilibacter corallicola]MCE2028975.1 phosphoglycerate dehydrogenase [Sessilibacter corallicola]